MKPYLFALIVLTGCTGVKSTALIETPARETNCKLGLYVQGEEPKEKYKTIGLLEMKGDHDQVSEYLPKLKAEACKLGADAIILPNGMTQKVVGFYYGAALSEGIAQAMAIKFEEALK